MKLPIAEVTLIDSMLEFDLWITPTLGEIRDTEKFRETLENIILGFDLLSEATNKFSNVELCHPKNLSTIILNVVNGFDLNQRISMLQNIAQLLYLVSGKTDNNSKCQLPIFLRDYARIKELIKVNNGNNAKISKVPIAKVRVLEAEDFMKSIGKLKDYPKEQEKYFRLFVEFILSDDKYTSQLWSVGYSYSILKSIGKEADLLTPLAIFQIRGSVSASGGHDPEDILRGNLIEWGLQAGIDYNNEDIPLKQLIEIPQSEENKKTRAYDFILPFKTWPRGKKLFVQCQFYAGDSGSVSHKNVDQTRSTRDATFKHYQDAIFIEYVDGAGYFASLNGDLRTLLSMPDTASFFQIRSIPIKLRRELQKMGFLTPLEIEQAILIVGSNINSVKEYITKNGYLVEEINRCLSDAIKSGIIVFNENEKQILIKSERRSIVRTYCLLDLIAIYGTILETSNTQGKLLIPGYGTFYGIAQKELIEIALKKIPSLQEDWQDVRKPFEDIQWLIDNKYVIPT
jgi:hypothetical protein